jgi:hypothetical protein
MRATGCIGLALAILPVAASSARACPVCDTPTGQQVRDGLAGGDLPRTVSAVVLPFVVVFGVAALARSQWGGKGGGHADER